MRAACLEEEDAWLSYRANVEANHVAAQEAGRIMVEWRESVCYTEMELESGDEGEETTVEYPGTPDGHWREKADGGEEEEEESGPVATWDRVRNGPQSISTIQQELGFRVIKCMI